MSEVVDVLTLPLLRLFRVCYCESESWWLPLLWPGHEGGLRNGCAALQTRVWSTKQPTSDVQLRLYAWTGIWIEKGKKLLSIEFREGDTDIWLKVILVLMSKAIMYFGLYSFFSRRNWLSAIFANWLHKSEIEIFTLNFLIYKSLSHFQSAFLISIFN